MKIFNATFDNTLARSILSACVGGVLFAWLLLASPPVFSQSAAPITGWAWSDAVGWISLHCSTGSPSGGSLCATRNYGLTRNADNTVTGFAWSDNIGWIKFGGLSGFPTGGGTTPSNAIFNTNQLAGWARACAAFQSSDCSGPLSSDAGGWDGWISLSGTGYNAMADSFGLFTGWAWDSGSIGWIRFQGSLAPPCTPSYQCIAGGTQSQYTDLWCQTTATACQYGCSTSTGQCHSVAPPAGCLSTSPLPSCVHSSRARAGQTVKLYWNISNANSCTLNGSAVSTASPAQGYTTAAVQRRTVFTLTCTGDSGTMTDTAVVTLVPAVQEI